MAEGGKNRTLDKRRRLLGNMRWILPVRVKDWRSFLLRLFYAAAYFDRFACPAAIIALFYMTARIKIQMLPCDHHFVSIQSADWLNSDPLLQRDSFSSCFFMFSFLRGTVNYVKEFASNEAANLMFIYDFFFFPPVILDDL